LPFASLDLAVKPEGFNYGGYHLTKSVSLADLKVRGLRNTYRKAGVGAALSAQVEPQADSTASRWIPPNAKVPITAFVRFDDPRSLPESAIRHRHVMVETELSPLDNPI
jgi:hypothetical protein